MNHDSCAPNYIGQILRDVRTIALVGASANPSRPSYDVMKFLIDVGFNVIPVNPGLAGQDLLGQRVYTSLADIPLSIDMIDIFRNSDAAFEVVTDALALPITPKVIWMQLGVINHQAAAAAETVGLRVVMNRCPKIEFHKLKSS
jgi:uncharacterized protein